MSDNITNIDEARFQRHRRLLQEQIALAARQAAAAYLAHLEAVARGAPREVVNHRWLRVEERAIAYQELLQTGELALESGLDLDLREQIDGEFAADWLELLREECVGASQGHTPGELGLFLACQAAYRRGYAAGITSASRLIERGGDE